MIESEKIGARIRYLRKQKHISQEKMAEDLGMYQTDISNLERATGGSGIHDLMKLDMIAEYFGVELTELLNGLKQPEIHEDISISTTPKERNIPKADENDIFAVDYTDLSAVYRFRLLLETMLKYPHVYDEVDDSKKRERKLLSKLKAYCVPEEAYKVWKKDLIDVKAHEISEKEHLIVCHYMFVGVGSYDEVIPEEMLPSFKCWIDHNGSAFFGGSRDANKKEIRRYAAMHIADDYLK